MKKLALVASVALSIVAVRSHLAAQAGKGVTLMLRAATDDGQPVLDLKPTDVTLKVNGKARAITSLTLLQFGAAPAAPAAPSGAPATPVSGAPAPFSTNAGGAVQRSNVPSRVVWIAIDDESFVAGNEQPARDAAQQLVDALSPADRIGVMTVPHGGRGLNPTSDRAQVKAALAAIAGRGDSGESDDDLSCRTGITLQAIRGVLQTMPSDEAGVVVFMSGGMSAPATGSGKTGGNRSSCTITPTEYQTVSSAAQSVGSAFYVVHLRDAMAGSSSRISSLTTGIEHLASTGAATLIRFSGRGENTTSRISKETAVFYTASFDPDPADKGATAKVEVKSARDKVKVRSASEVALKAAEAAGGGKTPSPKEMVRDVRPYRELPLRATTIAQRNTGDDRIKVIVLFEPEAGTITSATVGMVDDKGKLTAQWTAQDVDLAKTPPMFAVLAAPAGNYRVRVAAADSTGKGGAVDDTFTAGLTPAGANLKLSGLSLWSQNDKGLVPKLQFTNEPEAIAMFELYGRPAGKMGAQIQIATTPDGPPINKNPIQVEAAGTSEADRFTLVAKVPIADLAPGDYVIRAMVGEEGQPEVKIIRTLRKLAK